MDCLRFSVSDGVANVVLARPKAANAINLQFAEEFASVIGECDERQDVRAVLLTAEGPIFSAGGDLAHFAKAGEQLPNELERMLALYHPAVQRMSEMDAPVIAAVNGVAAGAGFGLVLGCSLVIGSEKARFTMAYTGAALTPDGSSTFYLPRIVGFRRAEELIVTNRVLSAHEALEWGLVNQIVPESDLLPKAENQAREIAMGPTLAFGKARRLLLESSASSLSDQLAREGRAIVASSQTADAREGIDAVLNKRKPSFQGT